MSYATPVIPFSLGLSQGGLSLEARPLTAAGASSNGGVAITTGFSDKGGGVYSWTGTVPDATAAVDVYTTGGTHVASLGISPADRLSVDAAGAVSLSAAAVAAVWAAATSALTTVGSIGAYLLSALAAIKGQTDKITANNINVVAGFARGQLAIRQGDGYTAAGGNALPVSKPDGAAYPATLAGWTITLTGKAKRDTLGDGTTYFTTALSCADPAGTQTLLIDALPAATTDPLIPKVNGWEYTIVATNGVLVNTLMSGVLSVFPKLTNG